MHVFIEKSADFSPKIERKGSPKGAQNRGNWVTIRAPCPEGLPERQIGAKAPKMEPKGGQIEPKVG